MLASSVSKNSALGVSGEQDLVRFEVPQKQVLRLGWRGAEVEIPRLGEVADRLQRAAVELCRGHRQLIALGRQPLLPGTGQIEPRALAVRAGELLVDIARHAGSDRAGPAFVGRDQAVGRGLDKGGLGRIEKAVGRSLRGLALWRLALRRLSGGGFRRNRGRRSDNPGAEQQPAPGDIVCHRALPAGERAASRLLQRVRAVASSILPQSNRSGGRGSTGPGSASPFIDPVRSSQGGTGDPGIIGPAGTEVTEIVEPTATGCAWVCGPIADVVLSWPCARHATGSTRTAPIRANGRINGRTSRGPALRRL